MLAFWRIGLFFVYFLFVVQLVVCVFCVASHLSVWPDQPVHMFPSVSSLLGLFCYVQVVSFVQFGSLYPKLSCLFDLF